MPRRLPRSLTTCLLLGSMIVLASTICVAADHRVRARVAEPFLVNGQLYEPGVLSLRQVSDYNPTSTINEVWVGNRCLGMLLAQQTNQAALSERDALLFTRTADGTLSLVGVSFRGEPVRNLFTYVEQANTARWVAPPRQADPATLVAAR